MSDGWDRRAAYVLLRLAMGVDFLGHGAVRLLHGNAAFAQGMVKQMAETPLPGPLVYGFGWILPFVEFAIGALLLTGLWTRWALVAGGLLMCALMLGVTLRQDWSTAGLQLTYSFLLSVLLFLRKDYDLDWAGMIRR